jgi:hypothetical protein
MALRDLIGEPIFGPLWCPFGLSDGTDGELAWSA